MRERHWELSSAVTGGTRPGVFPPLPESRRHVLRSPPPVSREGRTRRALTEAAWAPGISGRTGRRSAWTSSPVPSAAQPRSGAAPGGSLGQREARDQVSRRPAESGPGSLTVEKTGRLCRERPYLKNNHYENKHVHLSKSQGGVEWQSQKLWSKTAPVLN